MALTKNYVDEKTSLNVSNAYFKINRIILNPNRDVRFEVEMYVSKDARDSGKEASKNFGLYKVQNIETVVVPAIVGVEAVEAAPAIPASEGVEAVPAVEAVEGVEAVPAVTSNFYQDYFKTSVLEDSTNVLKQCYLYLKGQIEFFSDSSDS